MKQLKASHAACTAFLSGLLPESQRLHSLLRAGLWAIEYHEQDSTSEDAVTALHVAAVAAGLVYLRENKFHL